jgi:Bacterial inner membrane protein
VDWIEAIGYAGTGFTILAYCAKRMVTLRVIAVLSSVCFLSYAICVGARPIMLMEMTLLPINAYRLLELFYAAGNRETDRLSVPKDLTR